MSLNIKHKQMAPLAMLLVLFAVILAQGCGNSQHECEEAPDKSSIIITPSSQTMTPGATLDWTVVVVYPDNTPMPFACLTISGAQAVPNGTSYQFQFFPSSVIPNAPVNSGFTAKTDKFGQYTFSTLISATTGTSDTIFVRSGANIGTATLH